MLNVEKFHAGTNADRLVLRRQELPCTYRRGSIVGARGRHREGPFEAYRQGISFRAKCKARDHCLDVAKSLLRDTGAALCVVQPQTVTATQSKCPPVGAERQAFDVALFARQTYFSPARRLTGVQKHETAANDQ